MSTRTQGRSFTVDCTITVRQTWESLEADVVLDDGVLPGPGDRVRVHGEPIVVPFGESAVLRRPATVTRAGPLTRAWVRLQAWFNLTELYEVSFSPGRLT
jgi:hypothetical protein